MFAPHETNLPDNPLIASPPCSPRPIATSVGTPATLLNGHRQVARGSPLSELSAASVTPPPALSLLLQSPCPPQCSHPDMEPLIFGQSPPAFLPLPSSSRLASTCFSPCLGR